MAFMNFLTQGQPLPSSTSSLTTSQVPQYLSDYLYNLMSGAYSAAQQPYQAYEGPRIADFTQPQQQAFGMTTDAAGAYKPELAAAGQTAATAGGLSTIGAAQPYFNAATGNQVAAAGQPALSQAMGINAATAAQPYLSKAGATDIVGAAQPYLSQAKGINAATEAQPYLSQAGAINIAGAAQPYMSAAAASTPSQISSYMNPYIENVTNRMGDIASRQIKEKLMPAIGDQFIRAGQYGSTRQQELAQRGVRDISENLADQIGTTLAQGYNTAGTQAQQDLARQANLAQMAGSQAQQQGALQANIGQTAGSLANQQMANLTNLGQAAGSQAQQQGSLQANIGQTAGSLANQQMANLTSLGQAQGSLTAQDMSRLASMGQAAGTLTGTEEANKAALAGVQAGLGQKAQALGLTGAAATEAVGAEQQAMNQKNLDLAYQDFQTQTQYPEQQLGFLSNIVRGLPSGGATQAQSGTSMGSTYSASPLASLASAGLSAAALSNLLK
jgi:hypothetical protein